MASEMVFWEWVKGTGSVVGLASGLWLLWEKWVKHRPTFTLVRPPARGQSAPFVSLRVTNNSWRTLMLATDTEPGGAKLTVSGKRSVRSVIRAVRAKQAFWVVDPKSSVTFEAGLPFGYGADLSLEPLTLEIRWKFLQAIFPGKWHSERISISRQDVITLLD